MLLHILISNFLSYLCRTSSQNMKSVTSRVRPRTQRTCVRLRTSPRTCRPVTTTATSSALWMWWENHDHSTLTLIKCLCILHSYTTGSCSALKHPSDSSKVTINCILKFDVETCPLSHPFLAYWCGWQLPQFSESPAPTHNELKTSQSSNKANDVLSLLSQMLIVIWY